VEYEAGWRLTEINELEKRISQAEAARIQIYGELQAFEHDWMAHETGKAELPVEEDPRMDVLAQARQAALESLRTAENKLRRTK
jgi:septal ring factor EnvC (AmiA/AmiB activator)